MAFTNLEKTDMVLIYGEARGHSKLARQMYCERFSHRILPNARTIVNVVQHFRDFGGFEMDQGDLGRQRADRRSHFSLVVFRIQLVIMKSIKHNFYI
jgi:hypothetical protein